MQPQVYLRVTVAHEIEQVWTPVGDAGGACEPGKVPGTGRVELDVASVSTAVGPGAAAMDPRRRPQAAGIYIGTGVANQGEHSVEQRHLEALASSRALAGDQGHNDPGRSQEAAEV